MQIRCTYCQTMFAVSQDEMLSALDQMEEEGLKFYAAHCPKCRRANRIERTKLEFSYPGWREDIKKLAKQPATAAVLVAPKPRSEPVLSATKKKHGHKPAGQEAKLQKVTPLKPAPAKAKKEVAPAKRSPAAATVKATASRVKEPASKPASAVKKSLAKKPAGKTKSGAQKK